jgi:parallel beta-helix repeat protein
MLLILVLFLSVVLISFPQIGVVKAEGTIYIRADGTVEGTNKIRRNGNVYTFLGNISIEGSTVDGIIVERDNIVIDGAGYTLQETGDLSYVSRGINGINLTARNGVTVKNLRIMDFVFNVHLINSSNNTIFGNYICTSEIAISLGDSQNNSIIQNNLASNGEGIGITFYRFSVNDTASGNSFNNTICGNTMIEQGIGIKSLTGSKSIISGNNITNCTIYGIYLENYQQINMIGNNFENNAVGIFLGDKASNNTIYHNNFINNQKDVADVRSVTPWLHSPKNIWDNGSRGNYWSDYNGADNDGDDIGDSPHFVYENNQDNYPLMNPVDIVTLPEFPSWIILPIFLMATFVGVIVKKRLSQSVTRYTK